MQYLNDTYLFKSTAKIIEIDQDEKGKFFILDQTIFYPQGGGQPADTGFIISKTKKYVVKHVAHHENKIKHYIEETDIEPNLTEQTAHLEIDPEKRILHARLHSAAHLLSHVVEEVFPNAKAIKGHQFPNEAFIELEGDVNSFNDDILENIRIALKKLIAENIGTQTKMLTDDAAKKLAETLPYKLPEGKPIRVLAIGNYEPVPCGGTHVKNINEIGDIKIIKYKVKKDRLKIYYEVT